MQKFPLILLALIVFTGCVSNENAAPGGQKVHWFGSSPRHLEIFRAGERPSSAWSEIGLITQKGHLENQGKIEETMLSLARKRGAEGVIFDNPKRMDGGYLFRLQAFVYK